VTDLVSGRDRNPAAGVALRQSVGTVSQLPQWEADASGQAPGRERRQQRGYHQDDGAAGAVLAELFGDQAASLAGGIMELVSLEADGYAAKDAVSAILPRIIEDGCVGHDLLGAAHVGDID